MKKFKEVSNERKKKEYSGCLSDNYNLTELILCKQVELYGL